MTSSITENDFSKQIWHQTEQFSPYLRSDFTLFCTISSLFVQNQGRLENLFQRILEFVSYAWAVPALGKAMNLPLSRENWLFPHPFLSPRLTSRAIGRSRRKESWRRFFLSFPYTMYFWSKSLVDKSFGTSSHLLWAAREQELRLWSFLIGLRRRMGYVRR